MKNKVHLLVDGPQDERNIRAAFSTREAADAVVRTGVGTAVVQELVLDPVLPSPPKGQKPWYV